MNRNNNGDILDVRDSIVEVSNEVSVLRGWAFALASTHMDYATNDKSYVTKVAGPLMLDLVDRLTVVGARLDKLEASLTGFKLVLSEQVEGGVAP